MAILVTILISGTSVYIIISSFERGLDTTATQWAYSMIAFLAGIWITDRPKFITKKRKKTKKKTNNQSSSNPALDLHNSPIYPDTFDP